MGKKTKVVIDTNVIISAFGWHGKPEEVIKLITTDRIKNFISLEMLAELRNKEQVANLLPQRYALFCISPKEICMGVEYCKLCNGSGRTVIDHKEVLCPSCGATGRIRVNEQLPCKLCNGSGRTVINHKEALCPACGATGWFRG